MDIVGKLILQEFWGSDKKAKKPLERWIEVTELAIWNSFSDVKKTFNHADSYKQSGHKYVIFNVAGNKYRLITSIKYGKKLVIVAIVMTHKEYDREKWKDKL